MNCIKKHDPLIIADKMPAAQAEDVPTLDSLVEKAKNLFKETFDYEATAGGAAPGRYIVMLFTSSCDINIDSSSE